MRGERLVKGEREVQFEVVQRFASGEHGYGIAN